MHYKLKLLIFVWTILVTLNVYIANGKSVESRALQEDFRDFIDLIPIEEISKLASDYIQHDPQVKAIYKYVNSEEAEQVFKEIIDIPEIEEFTKWLRDELKTTVDGAILSDTPITDKESVEKDLGGWKGFIEKAAKIIPSQKLETLAKHKFKEGGAFSKFYYKMRAMKKVYERVQKSPKFIKFRKHLDNFGINTSRIDQMIHKIFKWDK